MKHRHKIAPASYLFLTKENKILLQRRFNTGFEDGNYSMVAGHVEEGESFSEALAREVKEEANIEIDQKDLKMIYTMHRKSTKKSQERIDMFFTTNKWKGEIKNMEPHKCDDLSWFEIDNLPKNIIPYVKKAIEDIKNKVIYSEEGWK